MKTEGHAVTSNGSQLIIGDGRGDIFYYDLGEQKPIFSQRGVHNDEILQVSSLESRCENVNVFFA